MTTGTGLAFSLAAQGKTVTPTLRKTDTALQRRTAGPGIEGPNDGVYLHLKADFGRKTWSLPHRDLKASAVSGAPQPAARSVYCPCCLTQEALLSRVKIFAYVPQELVEEYTSLARLSGAPRSELFWLGLHLGAPAARRSVESGSYLPRRRVAAPVSRAVGHLPGGAFDLLRHFGSGVVAQNPDIEPEVLISAVRSHASLLVPPVALSDLQLEGLVEALLGTDDGDLVPVPGNAPPDDMD